MEPASLRQELELKETTETFVIVGPRDGAQTTSLVRLKLIAEPWATWLIVVQDAREAQAAGISLQAPAKSQAGISLSGPEDFHVVGPREVQVEGIGVFAPGLC